MRIDVMGVGFDSLTLNEVVTEALRRAREKGAQRAYVISDMDFYKKLGFEKDRIFTFYRKA